MRKLRKFLVFRINLVIFLCGLSVFTGFGQNERLRKCADNDYWCPVSNYQQIVLLSKCDAVRKTKDTKAVFECAQIEYTKIIEQNPNDWAAYFARGMFFFGKNPEQSLADMSKALELNPNFSLIYTSLASIYRKKGADDEALRLLNKVIELDPNYTSAYNNRGYLFRFRRDFNSALADFNKYIELDPKSPTGYTARAWTYFDMGDFEKALADLKKAHELNKNHWDGYYQLGAFYWRRGEFARAAINCQIARELKAFSIDYRRNINNKYCSL